MNRNFLLSLVALFLGTSAVNAQNDRFDRCVLLEEFTTENCAICPHITKYVHQLMDDPGYNKKVVVVTHHSGFYEDFLTTQADRELKWFYNENTYTPGFMFDRYPFFNTQNTSELTPTSVALVNNLPAFKEYVDTRMEVQPNVAVELSAVYDGSDELKVTVTGERNAEFDVKDPRITVYLIENNIKAEKQKGVKEDYVHQYSLREYNSVMGEPIVWQDDKFTYDCTLPVKQSYKQDDLNIIAFVSNYNPDDPTDCIVENTRSLSFSTLLGIDDAQMNDDLLNTEYFTIDGIKVNDASGGMFIQKKQFANGDIEVKKVVR